MMTKQEKTQAALDAKRFAKLAKEIEAGLRAGAYARVSLLFSDSPRARAEANAYDGPNKGNRTPITLKITYSGRKR